MKNKVNVKKHVSCDRCGDKVRYIVYYNGRQLCASCYSDEIKLPIEMRALGDTGHPL